MQIRNDQSPGKSTKPDETEDLLGCRLAMLGLDLKAIKRGYSETLEKITRRCMNCGLREACSLDLKNDPNNPVWESYCPNTGVLVALVALTEVGTIV